MRALSTSTRAQLTVRAPTLLARQQRGRLFDAGAGVTGARPRLSVTTSHARGINTSGINSAQPGTGRAASGRMQFYAQELSAVQAAVEAAAPSEGLVLHSEPDRYGGVLIGPDALPSDPSEFQQALEHSMSVWGSEGVMGVWINIPREKVALVPVATAAGFDFHHAEAGHVLMNFWLPEHTPSTLPRCATTQIGVGAFVLNEQREVLVVSERNGPAAKTEFRLYKLPTGLVDLGEDVPDAAQREVREETGIDTEFVAVLGMRHAHRVAFGRGDMFFLCALRPVGEQTIRMCDTELIDAKWMALEDFVALNATHIQPNTEMAYLYDLCVQFADGQRSGLEVHQAAPTAGSARVPPYMYANKLCAHGSPIARSRRAHGWEPPL